MPLYEYTCVKCKKVVEVQQKITEHRLPPVCCEDDCNIEMVPLVSKTNFLLKGSGWARDGYSGKKR